MTGLNDASRKRWQWPMALFALSAFALALRWYYVSHAIVLQPVRGDAIQYVAYASNLAQHGVFAKDAIGATTLHPDNYRDPGYPFFLAIWMKWLGSAGVWYAAVLLCQALLGALTVTLATQLGRHWLPARWAFVAGLLMAVWPHSITVNGYLLSETLFGFLCVLGALLCAKACQRESLRFAILAGFVFGVAALTNAVFLPFGILLALCLAWRRQVAPRIFVALALGSLLLPCAWAIRNTQIAPPPTDSSSVARALQNLEQGSWPDFQSAWRNSVLGDPVAKADAQVILQKVDDEYKLFRSSPRHGATIMLQRFASHPLHYAKWYLLDKPMLLWGWSIEIGQGDIYVFPTVNSPFESQAVWTALAAICHGINLSLMLMALLSAIFVWPTRSPLAGPARGNKPALICVLAVVLYVTLVYTALQAEPRYAIPFRSFEILLAITTLSGVVRWVQAHRTRLDPA
jgi:4-amino-4-deoxy-L-arabinose transferase-like glycosyltransferase